MLDMKEVWDGAWLGRVKYGVTNLIIVAQGKVDIHINSGIIGHDYLFGDPSGARQ